VNINSWKDQLGQDQSSVDYELNKADWNKDVPKYIFIRQEINDDHFIVESLTRDAFWNGYRDENSICDEHLLTHRMRNCNAFLPQLSFVALIDKKIVGHIIYTKAKVGKYEVLTFGPLAVLPEYQGGGVGKALMNQSFAVATDMGFKAVIIYGHPDYYTRVGFERASEYGITTPDGNVFDALMVKWLCPESAENIQGKFYLDSVYENLSQEDSIDFDKKFLLKELPQLTPIGVLYDELKDRVKIDSLKILNYKFLDQFRSKSEREILLLDSIEKPDIIIIKRVLQANGINWGK